MLIVGVCGKAGAGKDTVADFLVQDYGFVKVALADPLKRIARDVFEFSDEQLWGPSEKRNAPDSRYPRGMREGDQCLTPRYALQQLGTEWGRNCYPNVWVDYALRVAKTLLDRDKRRGDPMYRYNARTGLEHADLNFTGVEHFDKFVEGVVISDVRFRNEVDAIKKVGGLVWRIDRPGAGLEGAAAQHASEKEQDGIPAELFDVILNNENKSLDDLRRLVSIAAGTRKT